MNDHHYKKHFLQILSIESGSQEELEKRVRIMDITANIEAYRESMETVHPNLNLNLQRISPDHRSLMRDHTNYRQHAWNDTR